MFDIDKSLSMLEVLTKRLAKLRRERETLQDLMQADISYAAYNALMHALWRIDRDIKDTQGKLQVEDKLVNPVEHTYDVRLTETRIYDVEVTAESVEQAKLFAPQKLNGDPEVTSSTVKAEVMGVHIF